MAVVVPPGPVVGVARVLPCAASIAFARSVSFVGMVAANSQGPPGARVNRPTTSRSGSAVDEAEVPSPPDGDAAGEVDGDEEAPGVGVEDSGSTDFTDSSTNSPVFTVPRAITSRTLSSNDDFWDSPPTPLLARALSTRCCHCIPSSSAAVSAFAQPSTVLASTAALLRSVYSVSIVWASSRLNPGSWDPWLASGPDPPSVEHPARPVPSTAQHSTPTPILLHRVGSVRRFPRSVMAQT